MKLIKRLHVLTTGLLTASLAAGCAVPSFEKIERPPSLSSTFDELVTKDVVSVLQQVDRLAPSSTTLGTFDSSLQQSAFAEALTDELRAAGYAIRAVAAGPGTLSVSYSMEPTDVGDVAGSSLVAEQSAQTVTVTVGDVAVRRSYISQADGQVLPVGTMQIRGVDASTLKLDNDIFSTQTVKAQQASSPAAPPTNTVAEDEQLVDVKQVSQVQPARTQVAQTAQLVEPQSVQQPSAGVAFLVAANASRPLLDLVAPSVTTAESQSFDSVSTLAENKTQNVLQLQQSNFESLFVEMGIVDEKVLTFENDSTRMGGLNKARLVELLENFNPESDILSVIGCSLGPTTYAGGQEGLARGRAERIREELLYAGIPDSKILAEGCWAEETFDERMPRRGVVVTLKRPVG